MDYIKSMFKNFTKESYGLTGLPIDVEKELFEENRRDEPYNTKENDQPTYRYHSDYSSEQFFSQFNDMLGDLHKMTEGFFGNENRIFLHELPNGDHDRRRDDEVQSQDKSLRDKMFENNDQNSFDLFSFDGDKRTDDPFSSFFFTFRSPFSSLPNTCERNEDCQIDNDLDQDIDNGDLSIDDVLDDKKPRGEHMVSPYMPPFTGEEFITDSPSLTSAFKYSTIVKKINPDGTVETIKKRKDSDGNEEETTSRTMDNQTHSITTKRNVHGGTEEHTENLLNMNEDELKNFEEKWKDKKKDEARSHILQPRTKDNKSSWWW